MKILIKKKKIEDLLDRLGQLSLLDYLAIGPPMEISKLKNPERLFPLFGFAICRWT